MRCLPAEWEPQSVVQLTFPHQNTDWADCLDEVLPCFVAIAETISRFQPVLIVCHDEAETRSLITGGNQANQFFVQCETNDTWARDHGGITVMEKGKPLLLDFVFNGWGLKFPADKDNLITRHLHKKKVLKAPIRQGGLVLEGGGIESNGEGILLTTSHCLLSPNRNPHLNKRQIEQKLTKIFGLQKIIWLDHGYLAGDDTDSHIDTLARFCDPDTIAYVASSDPSDEHHTELTKMEAQLRTACKPDGSPFNLVKLPMADPVFDADGHRLPATYANFLIINGAVLVPTYNSPLDQTALSTLQGVFPNRMVIGIDCRALILQHGSLHCVTMQYPAGVF